MAVYPRPDPRGHRGARGVREAGGEVKGNEYELAKFPLRIPWIPCDIAAFAVRSMDGRRAVSHDDGRLMSILDAYTLAIACGLCAAWGAAWVLGKVKA